MYMCILKNIFFFKSQKISIDESRIRIHVCEADWITLFKKMHLEHFYIIV